MWRHRTNVGRIVYSRPTNLFTIRDFVRIGLNIGIPKIPLIKPGPPFGYNYSQKLAWYKKQPWVYAPYFKYMGATYDPRDILFIMEMPFWNDFHAYWATKIPWADWERFKASILVDAVKEVIPDPEE